jgi:hypothetical protein
MSLEIRNLVPSRMITMRRVPSAAKTRALVPRVPLGSITTRAGFGPETRRTVSCGSSARTVPAPTMTASTRERRRCK